MRIKLAQIEARLQSLIEGSAARLFPGAGPQPNLASHLMEAMHAGILTGPEGEAIAPNLYTLYSPPYQARLLEENPVLLDELMRTLLEAGAETGLVFPSPPQLRIEPDPALAPGDWRVVAQNSLENLTETTDLEGMEDADEAAALPANAFLIVDGTQIYPLEQAVINIGRRGDNQLVLDDPRVSRVHAQLRAVRGNFVIFDLDSTGGTFVNGEPVSQHRLSPGDVVSLAGVPLVFGQDPTGDTQDTPPPGDGHTQSLPPS